MPVDFLVDRIASCGWRESLLRLAHVAAIVANDQAGPNSHRACALTTAGIQAITAATPAAQAMLAHARQYLANASRPPILAHEEALLFLQHVVLLHGSDTSTDGPKDPELALWLLGASDHLGEWAKPDDRAMTDTERAAAELVKIARFNRTEDSVRAAIRTDGLFGNGPWHGKLAADPWPRMQQVAFGESFHGYFDSFVLPLFTLSHIWGTGQLDGDEYPIINPARFVAFGGEGPRFLARLRSITATRDELRLQIRQRMKPDGLLPHAPTALLHHPLVDLGEHGILAATPWYVRNFVRTGIWNQYRGAAKQIVGDKNGGTEWNRAFGQMFEQWVRAYASKASPQTRSKTRIVLPSHPGSKDEIEDVVTIEPKGVVMFSAKGRMVPEDVARYSLSRRELLDWYEQYFFDNRGDEFRGGAIRLLSARIDMLRRGEFEDRGLSKHVRVHPVIVTYDVLGDNQMLHVWLRDRCKAHGLMQQPNVGALALAAVQHYEWLIGAAAYGRSIVEILEKRNTKLWANERLDVLLNALDVPVRLPGYQPEYAALMQRMAPRIGISADGVAKASDRLFSPRRASSDRRQ
jgi:hypothetical protein